MREQQAQQKKQRFIKRSTTGTGLCSPDEREGMPLVFLRQVLRALKGPLSHRRRPSLPTPTHRSSIGRGKRMEEGVALPCRERSTENWDIPIALATIVPQLDVIHEVMYDHKSRIAEIPSTDTSMVAKRFNHSCGSSESKKSDGLKVDSGYGKQRHSTFRQLLLLLFSERTRSTIQSKKSVFSRFFFFWVTAFLNSKIVGNHAILAQQYHYL